jgi:hypothetical protein
MPANTPIYNFPYPLGTDPVSQGDNDIRALAEDVETVIAPIDDKLGSGVSLASGASAGSVIVADGLGGSAWQAPTAGLVHVGSFTANGTSRALVCDNIFTSQYDTYRIYFTLNSTINTNGCFFQYINTAGTTLNTGYGGTAYGMDYFGGTTTFTATLSATTVQFIGYLPNSTFGATKLNAIVDIGNPFLNEPTQCTGTQSGIASGLTFHGGNINGTHNVAATLRGIRIDNSGAGNLTGKVRVYGYRN